MPTLTSLSKLAEHSDVGEALTSLVRDVNGKYAAGDANVQVPVSARLWKAPGCHEFLASLGTFVHIRKKWVATAVPYLG